VRQENDLGADTLCYLIFSKYCASERAMRKQNDNCKIEFFSVADLQYQLHSIEKIFSIFEVVFISFKMLDRNR
jgi:hypothetical protein